MLGLCCELVAYSPTKGWANLLPCKTLQLGKLRERRYSDESIKQCYLSNLRELRWALPKILGLGIKFFRISSSLFPLYDQVNPETYLNSEVTEHLQAIGAYALRFGMRINTHPGQFVVLSSESPRVVYNSIRELNFHAWIFDQMGLPATPYYNINVHGGKSGRPSGLLRGIEKLQPSARKRLTLENDEFCYSVAELLPVCRESGTPMVFDSHHHTLNPDGLSDADALEKAIATWEATIRPTTHLSNTQPEMRSSSSIRDRRIHSEMIDYIPDSQLLAYKEGRIDIEVEAKAKNLAIDTLVARFEVTR